jgi:hypothetical protein
VITFGALGCGGGGPGTAGAGGKDGGAGAGAGGAGGIDGGIKPDGAAGTDASPDADAAAEAVDVANDVPADKGGFSDAGGDAVDGAQDVGADADASTAASNLVVLAAQNQINLTSCGVTPALLSGVAAGAHTVTLSASTLSKGFVSNVMAQDNFVIAKIPLPPGDPLSAQRFFTLNGIGAHKGFTLPAVGAIELMFIDSDAAYNSGTGTVTLDAPSTTTATVDAVANLIQWDNGCNSTPAQLVISNRPHHIALTASTLSAGSGSHDDYVLVRLPLEQVSTDQGFVILNGIGDGVDFAPVNNDTVLAWFITDTGGASGLATLTVTDL